MATAEMLLTAEEYLRLPDDGRPSELVRGRIVYMNVPAPKHGFVCANVAATLRDFVKQHDLGRVMSNDAGVVTERDPDTVRGPDVCYYSYARLPRGPLPNGYLSVVPELTFEILSPDDRWSKILAKVTEYLAAGVLMAFVVDPKTEQVTIYENENAPRTLGRDDRLTLAPVLPDFDVPAREFFD